MAETGRLTRRVIEALLNALDRDDSHSQNYEVQPPDVELDRLARGKAWLQGRLTRVPVEVERIRRRRDEEMSA